MKKIKRLRSVVHSIAHHAVSGLCYLHPHLGEQCERDGIKSITVDLINGITEPSLSEIPREIKLSIESLREKLYEIMKSEKIEKSFVRKATGTFSFDKHHCAKYCYIQVTTSNEKELQSVVSSMGDVGEIVGRHC